MGWWRGAGWVVPLVLSWLAAGRCNRRWRPGSPTPAGPRLRRMPLNRRLSTPDRPAQGPRLGLEAVFDLDRLHLVTIEVDVADLATLNDERNLQRVPARVTYDGVVLPDTGIRRQGLHRIAAGPVRQDRLQHRLPRVRPRAAAARPEEADAQQRRPGQLAAARAPGLRDLPTGGAAGAADGARPRHAERHPVRPVRGQGERRRRVPGPQLRRPRTTTATCTRVRVAATSSPTRSTSS